MPERDATIESLPVAIEVVKAMQAQGLDSGGGLSPAWPSGAGRDYRDGDGRGGRSLAGELEAEDAADRRSGYYRRSPLTELCDIELI